MFNEPLAAQRERKTRQDSLLAESWELRLMTWRSHRLT
jgi:hypothetical protein